MTFVARPARSSVTLAALPAAAGAVALALSPAALAVAVVGAALLAVGTDRASRRIVTAGGLLALAGVFLAGIEGIRPALVLVATAGAVVSWSTGQHVVGLARQLGQDAPIDRSVGVHLATVTVASLVAGGTTLAVFRLAGRGIPRAAIFFLVGGVALLLAAFEFG